MASSFYPESSLIDTLTPLLRGAGVGLILLAALHVPIARHLKWREDAQRLSPVNRNIFRVHAFFICVVLVIMGLPCLLEPAVFLEHSRAGAWLSWSLAVFWAIRLYCQWFVYESALWRNKRFETWMHWWFTLVWTALTALFAVCGMWQARWIS